MLAGRMPADHRTAWRAPAFAMTALCCRWPATADRDAAIGATALSSADWAAVVALARRHRVAGLVHEALRSAGVRPPDEAAEALAGEALAVAARSLAHAAETARLQALFDTAGIANLALKGAALEILAYGRLGLKSAWDIDLLVEEAAVDAARAVLEGEGYRFVAPAPAERFEDWRPMSKEAVFAGPRATVELHWRLVDSPRLLPGIGARSAAQAVRIGGATEVRTLARDTLFAYLCVHGASHGWSRLKWLADLAALISGDDDAGIERLWRRSQDLGAGAASAQALLLAERMLGRSLAPRLRHALRTDPKARLLVRLALAALAGEGEIESRPWIGDAVLAGHLLIGHGWAYRWSEIRRQGRSAHDRLAWPLPPGLRWLYALIRLPSWLGRRAARLRRP